ncbi:MAG: hypothetical protein WAV55_08605 [Clostridiaceae bacterium]
MFKSIWIIILSALASLIYLPVGDGSFRITFGIVVLIAALHLFKPKHPVALSFVTGLAIVILRIAVDSFSIEMTSSIASSYLLEIPYYLGYAVVYDWAITTNRSAYPLPLVVALVLCDTGANTIEYSLRNLAADTIWNSTSFYTILLAAFVRSVLIVFAVWAYQNTMSKKSTQKEEI